MKNIKRHDLKAVVLLLVGGDKSTQKRDIKTARDYWREYQGE